MMGGARAAAATGAAAVTRRSAACVRLGPQRAQRFASHAQGARCDFAIIGCGAPNRGMGWFHARQLLSGETPSARLTDIVEPWFLGAGAGSPGSEDFEAFRTDAEAQGVRFHSRVEEMPQGAAHVALIAARSADCPSLFAASIEKGCQHIYLEKPGAPSVEAMAEMAAVASASNVAVSMGYNKNVAGYVSAALGFESVNPGGLTTFVHNNAYAPEELDEW
jgi:hypothetical protein